ncbi:glycosyltransferase [Polaribacter pectinis]|uniref:Glycosyltransferase n=1 Tax=Polaribacter pectinis TaxID=2738844 RepID=A0A7G9L992_9FLAO|nr:glycosyltransferase [Polaribacter pectinis]QNM85191.1 glycosyltransferase [Polaribacter pectinis]
MKNKIIVAPLNWGLGHATRCVPIIKSLLENNFTPVIASDGNSLQFLQEEFPHLETVKLPSYDISYSKNLKLKLILNFPRILKSIQQEQKIINRFIDKNTDVAGLISDNRFGVRSNIVPSVYITHQTTVLSGITSFFSSKIHQNIINKFDECWIPDNENSEFSGKLSTSKSVSNQKFIGVLSRFKKKELEKKVDVLIILSGPEPNRTFLEKKLVSEFKNDKRSIVFVLGNVEGNQKKWTNNKCVFYNYLLSEELHNLINSSKILVCRSGYSSIMDLAVLEKKVFFIPTENQPEQEYLANYLQEKIVAPFCKIDEFRKERLLELENYKGLKTKETTLNASLFSLFHSKRKL